MQINVPVIPGLGWHLDELFFDKYNVKLDCEANKLEAAVVNREAKKAKKEAAAETEGAEDTEKCTGSGVDTTVREGAGGEEKGEAGSGCGSAVGGWSVVRGILSMWKDLVVFLCCRW